MAEAIDVHHPAVSMALKRLQDLGWLSRMARATPWAPASYHLHLPGVCKEVSTRNPAGGAGLLADTAVPAYVHPLFGAHGLGPGPAETFGALPELHRAAARGLHLVRIPRAASDPYPRRGEPAVDGLPRGRAGQGLTIRDLAAMTGKSRTTVSRHLKRLAAFGLVFIDGRDGYVDTVTGAVRWVDGNPPA